MPGLGCIIATRGEGGAYICILMTGYYCGYCGGCAGSEAARLDISPRPPSKSGYGVTIESGGIYIYIRGGGACLTSSTGAAGNSNWVCWASAGLPLASAVTNSSWGTRSGS